MDELDLRKDREEAEMWLKKEAGMKNGGKKRSVSKFVPCKKSKSESVIRVTGTIHERKVNDHFSSDNFERNVSELRRKNGESFNVSGNAIRETKK
ncbi:hypothetical protein CDAR_376221 [Caerostris darwini]|uniref:Uncharacterized protein n=1 Tax=Caerostris darwini TaxID=1538125 RepID=A0AAV4QN63_9ARAC|nr:hypothetical protein CDAR_376221 [Caerostris darwini]